MWRCTGLRWHEGEPAWGWWHPRHGGRMSGLRLGGPLAFAVDGDADRTCVGVWRAGRWTPCPHAALLRPEARRDQCEGCAAVDRQSSVAADTQADDPRPYAVYLAGFGSGRHKVGITGVRRGPARLLEQAAVCFTFLGEGPLMAARRTESVLGAALGVPDRVPAAAKRAARAALPDAAARAAELRVLYDRVLAVRERLPESLAVRPFEAVDHAAVFGLDPAPPRPDAEVSALPPDSALTGTVRAVAGHDVYVDTSDGCLLLDARLAAGWPLRRPGPDSAAAAVPTTPVRHPAQEPQPLF